MSQIAEVEDLNLSDRFRTNERQFVVLTMADVELDLLEKLKIFNTDKPNALTMADVESHIKDAKGLKMSKINRKKYKNSSRCPSSDHRKEEKDASATGKTAREDSSPQKIEEESGSNSRIQEVTEKPKGRTHKS